MNLYSYTANDPVNNTDPFGLQECPEGQVDCETRKVDDKTEEITVEGKKLKCDFDCQRQRRTDQIRADLRKQNELKQCVRSLRPNGCGSGLNEIFVPEFPFGLDFSQACRNHDNCVSRPGANNGRCTANFHADLNREVDRKTRSDGINGGFEQSIARFVAGAYALAVSGDLGEDAFNTAQRAAKACKAIEEGQ